MNQGLLIRLLICIVVLGGFLYTYIDKQNDLTELKIVIPELRGNLQKLQEENAELSLKIETLESPSHLLELLREKEFSHLHFPYIDEVKIIDEKN